MSSTSAAPPAVPPKITRKPPNRNAYAVHAATMPTGQPQNYQPVFPQPFQPYSIPQPLPIGPAGPGTMPFPVCPQVAPGMCPPYPFMFVKPGEIPQTTSGSGGNTSSWDPSSAPPQMVPFPMPYVFMQPPSWGGDQPDPNTARSIPVAPCVPTGVAGPPALDVTARVRTKLIENGTPAHLIYATPGGAVGKHLTCFILRLTPVVDCVEIATAILTWKSTWKTLLAMIAWVLLCIHPLLLSILPHFALLAVIYKISRQNSLPKSPPPLLSQPRSSMASVSSTTSSSSSKTLQNPSTDEGTSFKDESPEKLKLQQSVTTVDEFDVDDGIYGKEAYARNLQFFENSTESFCLLYDQLHKALRKLDWQDQKNASMAIKLLLLTFPIPILAAADPLVQKHFGSGSISPSPELRAFRYNAPFWIVTMPVLISGMCAFLYSTRICTWCSGVAKGLYWMFDTVLKERQKRALAAASAAAEATASAVGTPPKEEVVEEKEERKENKEMEEPRIERGRRKASDFNIRFLQDKKKVGHEKEKFRGESKRSMSEETIKAPNGRRKASDMAIKPEDNARVDEGYGESYTSRPGASALAALREVRSAKELRTLAGPSRGVSLIGKEMESAGGLTTTEFPAPKFVAERRKEPIDCELVEVYENQRWWAGAGWTSNLLPSDPPRWSDDTGNFVYQSVNDYPLPGSDWEWVDYWKTCGKDDRQTDGWEYHDNEWKNPTPQPTMSSLTRRRKWIRYMRRK